MKNNILTLFCIIAFSFMLGSCRVYKEQTGITYFKNIEDENIQPLLRPYSLKIKPDDELQITISSTIPQATSLYNLPAVNFIGRSDTEVTTSSTISTYSVMETGHIIIPNIGKIMVAGMTPEQLSEMLTRKIEETVKDPIVVVTLKNFKITVLGEVNKPGTKLIEGQRCSIFDAIGAAEDITLLGRRDNVILMREENGQVRNIRIDLTDTDIIKSPYYYLQQNDVIIVDATDIQKENSTYNTMNSFRLQMTSTIVSVVSVIASLGIALLFK